MLPKTLFSIRLSSWCPRLNTKNPPLGFTLFETPCQPPSPPCLLKIQCRYITFEYIWWNVQMQMLVISQPKASSNLATYTQGLEETNSQCLNQVLTCIFHTSGNWTELLANSTPNMSTFLARSHRGLGGEESVQPLNPRPEMIIAASEIDQMK